MPTVVLEAMAFGLPILTRKVGGLVVFGGVAHGAVLDSRRAVFYPQDVAKQSARRAKAMIRDHIFLQSNGARRPDGVF